MEQQEENKKKNEQNFVIILLILIALIIIIFLLIKNLGFIDHRVRIPTGNIDIFDIIFQQNCGNNCKCGCNGCISGNCGNCYYNYNHNNNNSSTTTNDGASNENENVNTTTPPEERDGVEVFDRQTEYDYDTQLKIFTNTTYYVVENKIAPLTENAYQFIIRNNNKFNIKYSLELNEQNEYDINMKYRLKLNGVYVAGDSDNWITYYELNQYDIGLSSKNYDVYTLEWKWFESPNDTAIGTNINSNYKLGLKIVAYEY